MSIPNFHQLEIFHTVARLQSFSNASKELLISQPSVSLQVKNLELYYGAPLFHRNGKTINLTAIGDIVFQYVEQVFQQTQEMHRSVDSLLSTVSGGLILGSSSTPGEYLAPRILRTYQSVHPKVDVTLHIGNSSTVCAQILAGEIDIGLVGEEISIPSITCMEFFNDELLVFASPNHPFTEHIITPTLLSSERFIMREEGSATRKIAESHMKDLGVSLQTAMVLGSNEAVKRAVAAGSGLGILSKLALKVDIEAKAVKTLQVSGLNCQRKFYILHHANRYLNRPQQAFLDIVAKSTF